MAVSGESYLITFLWTATDFENKLREYPCYYSEYLAHSGRHGDTPGKRPAVRW